MGDKRQRETAPAAKPAKQTKTKSSNATSGKKGKKAATSAATVTNGTTIKKKQVEPAPMKADERDYLEWLGARQSEQTLDQDEETEIVLRSVTVLRHSSVGSARRSGRTIYRHGSSTTQLKTSC